MHYQRNADVLIDLDENVLKKYYTRTFFIRKQNRFDKTIPLLLFDNPCLLINRMHIFEQ